MTHFKTLITVAIACLLCNPAWAQSDSTQQQADATQEYDPNVYIQIGENPKFPGGEDSCAKFIAKNLRYPPKEAQEKGIKGRVYAKFTIDPLGFVVNPKIIRSVSPLSDQEVLRVIAPCQDALRATIRKTTDCNLPPAYTLPFTTIGNTKALIQNSTLLAK